MSILSAGFFCLTGPGNIAYADDPSPVAPVTDSNSQTPVKSFQPADSHTPPGNQAVASNQAETTLEFMMGGSSIIQAVPGTLDVLSASSGAPATPPAVAAPGNVQPPGVTPGPVPEPGDIMEQLRSVAQDPDSVAMLVSETCEQSGDGDEGTVSCKRAYSNGNYAIVVTQRAAAGDEFKLQSVIKEYDKDGDLLYTKTIRQRIDYNYYHKDSGKSDHEDRGKERELIDIVLEPAGEKTNRELIIFQFDLETGKVKAMTWAQYEQIGNQPKAGLVYHATLHYDQNGDPLRGVAERWDHGRKVASYLDWSALSQGRLGFDKESWHEWESWIQSISLQAYLP